MNLTKLARLLLGDWSSASLVFWLLIVFILLVFFTGGSSRSDVTSLAILRPVSTILGGFAVWKLQRQHIISNSFICALGIGAFALTAIYLIPLPHSLWAELPGHEIQSQVQSSVGLVQPWQPISMDIQTSWNAFFALAVPFTVMLLGIQLDRKERAMLLPVMMGFLLVSGILGLFQSIGERQSSLYFYGISNFGSAVGLFSNRNHQAVMLACLFPMLAVYASSEIRDETQAKLRGGFAIAAGAILVPLILVTGSRAGLIFGTFGLISVFFLYKKPMLSTVKRRRHSKFSLNLLIGTLGILVLATITILMSRAESFARLTSTDQTDDLRWDIWSAVLHGASYLPLGSGPGSFFRIFQLSEPDSLLKSAYLNQAHNDWLDVYVTSGVPGLIAIVAIILYMLRFMLMQLGTHSSDHRKGRLAKLGFVIVIILGSASLVDYPLRTPIGIVVFIVSLLWMSGIIHSRYSVANEK